MATQDQPVTPEDKALQARAATLVVQGALVRLGQLAAVERSVRQARQELLVLLAQPDLRVLLEQSGQSELLAQLDQLGKPVRSALLPLDLRDPQVPQDRLDQRARPER